MLNLCSIPHVLVLAVLSAGAPTAQQMPGRFTFENPNLPFVTSSTVNTQHIQVTLTVNQLSFVQARGVLFHGGTDFVMRSADTREFTGTGVNVLTPATMPSARSGHAAAWDSRREYVVMTFGETDSGLDSKTWEYRLDGTTDAPPNWVLANPAHSPSARLDHTMAYDPVRGKTVLFGGASDLAYLTLLNDTWEWDGSDWTKIDTQNSPSPRFEAQMVYDEGLQAIVLFGGGDNAGVVGDTWKYDGSNWVQLFSAHSPAARAGHAMAYHDARGRIVLFGGFDAMACFGDTWEFDGTDWIQAVTINSPAPRAGHTMSYDPFNRRIVLIGGDNILNVFSEIWFLSSTSPATYDLFGDGCPGTVGIPTLNAAPNSWPWIDDTFTVQLGNLPPGNSSAFVIFGFSNTDWAGIPLPADLTQLGVWGCTAYASVEAAFPVGTTNGTAQLPFQIPLDTSLLGVEFYNQGAIVDPGVNPVGLTVTNAAKGVLGLK